MVDLGLVGIEKRCNDFASDFKFNYEKSKHYSRLSAASTLAILPFLLGLYYVQTNYLKNDFIYYLLAILILGTGFSLAYMFSQKSNTFQYYAKEIWVYNLCMEAEYLSSFVKSSTNEDALKKAIQFNNELRYTTTTSNSSVSGPQSQFVFIDRGFKFDKNIIKLLNLLNKASRTLIKEALTGKRDNERLNSLVIHLRKIACFILDEDIDKAIFYLEHEMSIQKDSDKNFTEFMQRVIGQETVRWVSAFSLLGFGLLIIYLVSKSLGIINDEPVPIWVIFGVFLAFIAASEKTKKFVDRLTDFLTRKKNL